MTWLLPQTSIQNWSHTLSGINTETPSANPIMFDVMLSAITSTGGYINFSPINSTRIFSILFSVILVNSCSGQIEMQYIGKYAVIKSILQQILIVDLETVLDKM
jgi:hypothetical protein